jgi:UDP-N-acetylglucosamine/UDP-N-acetylgalactosamine diphosphorylase
VQTAKPDSEAIRARFARHHQSHVFRFWDELDPAGREELLSQAEAIDLGELERVHRERVRGEEAREPSFEPAPVERLPSPGGDPARVERARARGEELLGAGRVGVLVVAGGQATRLGFPGPKGAFPLGPVTGRSLFEQQAQKIRRLRARTGRPIPWYVMTSRATHAPTREHFEKSDFFRLPPEDVVFFQQGMVPSLDPEGRLLLEERGRIFENPDGHGGSLTALLRSGALDDLERRGVDTIFYYQVDNPLVRIADPVFLGLHALSGAEMSCKVIRKLDPMEKVGVVARVDGRVAVIEYTEISDAHRHARDARGELVYWASRAARRSCCRSTPRPSRSRAWMRRAGA